jgi:hypothetical protein
LESKAWRDVISVGNSLVTGLLDEPVESVEEPEELESAVESPELGSVAEPPELGSLEALPVLGSVIESPELESLGSSSSTELKSVLAWATALVLVVSVVSVVPSPDDGPVGAADALG